MTVGMELKEPCDKCKEYLHIISMITDLLEEKKLGISQDGETVDAIKEVLNDHFIGHNED